MNRRSTPTKEAVLNLLVKEGKAMSQDAIERNIKISINRATVYRVLNSFCEDGVLHRIVAEDGKQYFAVCINCEEKTMAEHHFHFRCTECQTIECLPNKVSFSVPEHYNVKSVNCILSGTCARCAA